MGVSMSGELFNGTSVRITHGPSKTVISTAPPVDNGGDGSSFSPTDLCAASLGACATTIMALYAKRNNIKVSSIKFEVEKEMSPAPRKIAKLTCRYRIQGDFSDAEFDEIVKAGKTCPVRLTLGPDTQVDEAYSRN